MLMPASALISAVVVAWKRVRERAAVLRSAKGHYLLVKYWRFFVVLFHLGWALLPSHPTQCRKEDQSNVR